MCQGNIWIKEIFDGGGGGKREISRYLVSCYSCQNVMEGNVSPSFYIAGYSNYSVMILVAGFFPIGKKRFTVRNLHKVLVHVK